MSEENEFELKAQKPSTSFNITESMLFSLKQTKPWTKLISIIGFIYVGFMIIFGIGGSFMFSRFGSSNSFPSSITLTVIYLLLGILYFFPCLFLFRFSSSIGRLLEGGGAAEMEEALVNQKSFWKFVGILAIISIIMAIVGIIAAVAIPLFFSMAR